MKYQRAVVNGEVIAGESISQVYPPSPTSLTWRIVLKNGAMIEAIGNVSLWIRKNEGE